MTKISVTLSIDDGLYSMIMKAANTQNVKKSKFVNMLLNRGYHSWLRGLQTELGRNMTKMIEADHID